MHLDCPSAVSVLIRDESWCKRAEWSILWPLVSPTSSLFYIHHPPSSSPVFSSPLLSFCLLSFSPLSSRPQLSLLPITFCLSVAQHSTSWLSLNIDRKVNDNTPQVVHAAEIQCRFKQAQTYTHKEVTTWLMSVACCAARKQGHAMGRCQKTLMSKHSLTHTHRKSDIEVWTLAEIGLFATAGNCEICVLV